VYAAPTRRSGIADADAGRCGWMRVAGSAGDAAHHQVVELGDGVIVAGHLAVAMEVEQHAACRAPTRGGHHASGCLPNTVADRDGASVRADRAGGVGAIAALRTLGSVGVGGGDGARVEEAQRRCHRVVRNHHLVQPRQLRLGTLGHTRRVRVGSVVDGDGGGAVRSASRVERAHRDERAAAQQRGRRALAKCARHAHRARRLVRTKARHYLVRVGIGSCVARRVRLPRRRWRRRGCRRGGPRRWSCELHRCRCGARLHGLCWRRIARDPQPPLTPIAAEAVGDLLPIRQTADAACLELSQKTDAIRRETRAELSQVRVA
jgi:hypothetical protein